MKRIHRLPDTENVSVSWHHHDIPSAYFRPSQIHRHDLLGDYRGRKQPARLNLLIYIYPMDHAFHISCANKLQRLMGFNMTRLILMGPKYIKGQRTINAVLTSDVPDCFEERQAHIWIIHNSSTLKCRRWIFKILSRERQLFYWNIYLMLWCLISQLCKIPSQVYL